MSNGPPRPFAAAAPLPSSTLPLLPPLLDPELNNSTPLLPAWPPFTLRITTAPDVDAVPSPDDTVTAPPVAAVDLPEDACSDPPAPLVPLPTDTTTSPPRPFAAAAPVSYTPLTLPPIYSV